MTKREDEQQTPDEQQTQDEPQAQPEQSEQPAADNSEGEGHDGGAEQPETGRRPDFIAEQQVEVTQQDSEQSE